MSTTEWKFVPVEPTREMLVAALKTNGACPIYAAMLDAAPVPPSVESLLENWTPSDQQAFAKFRDKHFPGEMDSYAIQSLGSAWKDGQANAAPQPTVHLTIPGALEWDGDNGTHGVVGTHGEDGESLADHSGDTNEKAAYTAVDMTTAAAGGFRDGQTAANDSLKSFASELIAAALEGGSFDGGDIQDIAVKHGLLQVEQRAEECGEVCACREYGFPAECYRKTGLVKGGDDE